MSDFNDQAWRELLALVEGDDGDGIEARALSLQDSGVLEWRHPDDEMRRTPLMLAYWEGCLAAAASLARAGADFLAKDAKGRTVTWYAQNFGRGRTEQAMARTITATGRRLSMESVIRKKSGDFTPKPVRRRRGPGQL